MTLYIAVTPDHLELPMYVAETAEEMAAWAGVKAQTVRANCSRNKHKKPLKIGRGIGAPYRLRRLDFEEDEP